MCTAVNLNVHMKQIVTNDNAGRIAVAHYTGSGVL